MFFLKKAVTGPVPIYWVRFNPCCIAQVSVAELPYLNSWSCSKPYKIKVNSTLDQKLLEQIGHQPLRDKFCSSYASFHCRGSCRAASCWNMALCNAAGPYWLLTNSWLIKTICFFYLPWDYQQGLFSTSNNICSAHFLEWPINSVGEDSDDP